MPYPRVNPDLFPTHEERANFFSNWVSSYYAHPFFSSDLTPEERDKNVKNLIPLIPNNDEKYRPSTFEAMSQAERDECLHVPGGDFDLLLILTGPHVLFDLTRGTFLADHDSAGGDKISKAPFLKDMKITYIYCQASMWATVAGAWNVENDIGTWTKEGRNVRPTTILGVEGANHFVSFVSVLTLAQMSYFIHFACSVPLGRARKVLGHDRSICVGQLNPSL